MRELLASHHFFSLFGGRFDGFTGCFGGAFNGFAGRFGGAFDSITGRFGSFTHHFASRFSVGFSVGSHGVDGFTSLFSGFRASGKAKSRSGDGGGKNELTHNAKSFFNE
ncbi:MAG: hypothetical protein AAFZ11_09450 [Pseudomonadota bacterium]